MYGGVKFIPLYCHNPSCRLFNEEQMFAWADDTWQQPAEWVDEPECHACYSDMQGNDDPLDVQDFLEELVENFNDDWMDWTTSDREFFQTAVNYQHYLTAKENN